MVREHDRYRAIGGRLARDHAQQIEAVAPRREPDVDDDHVRPQPAHRVDAVGRGFHAADDRNVVVGLEPFDDPLGQDAGVLDDENAQPLVVRLHVGFGPVSNRQLIMRALAHPFLRYPQPAVPRM